ncbi:MAG: non-ribosomal peptide synthetase, partial [Acidimicrobiia bacterium]|nr:non-ribosomal peptide synthetase [Acidimicrobiia bacterium]
MSAYDHQREKLFALLLEDEGLELGPAPWIVRRSGREEAPLSSAQARLWFLDRLDGPTPNYNMPGMLRLTGALDLDALRASLRAIRDRHETLRTRFLLRGDEPVQVIEPPGDFPLPVSDLTALDAESREATFRRLVSEEAARPFDLPLGPLLRAHLVRLGERAHALLFVMHHIISDGWSIGVLIRELVSLYRSYHDGDAPDLEPLPFQYADYVEWQRARLSDEVLRPQLAYWRDRLAGAPDALGLPTDRPRPSVQTFRGRVECFPIGAGLTKRLKSLGRQCDSTLFMVLHAGFASLLARYSGADDVLVGTPVANRTQPGIDRLIGFFVNTLVLRTDLSGDPTFAELIARVRHASLRDFSHQDVPFERLVDELRPQRSLSHSPLFQVMFI